ncbi:LacI family DNA-binding transcriptional regulator [Microbacterium saperdae]
MPDSPSHATRRVTLAEVARHAGVSVGAVSQVVNNNPSSRISPAVRERIVEAIATLNYRTNIVARSLRLSSTNTLGFISDSVTITRFATGILRGALRAASSQNQMMLIAETEGDPEQERRAVESLLDRQVDGIVFAAMKNRRSRAVDLPLGFPHVYVNLLASEPALSVLPDDFEGGRAAVRTLLDAGHDARIALVGATLDPPRNAGLSPTAYRRLSGLSDEMSSRGLTFIREMPIRNWEPDLAYEATLELLQDTYPSAIVCLNDRVAFGVYQALAEARLKVPDDISVVSFDDDEIAATLRPALTTVAIPHEEMGRIAVETMNDGMTGSSEVLVPMPVRMRGSVCGPR